MHRRASNGSCLLRLLVPFRGRIPNRGRGCYRRPRTPLTAPDSPRFHAANRHRKAPPIAPRSGHESAAQSTAKRVGIRKRIGNAKRGHSDRGADRSPAPRNRERDQTSAHPSQKKRRMGHLLIACVDGKLGQPPLPVFQYLAQLHNQHASQRTHI